VDSDERADGHVTDGTVGGGGALGGDAVGGDGVGGFDPGLRERLAGAVDRARSAVLEVSPDGVGEHLGVEVEAPFTTTHSFAAELVGYRGWRWACVLALVPGAEDVTVDEISLLPGPDAVVAPEWVPWEKRIRPGDLGAGDLLPPAEDDERLVPGQLLSGDEELDELAGPVGLGRPRHLSREGRSAAAERWTAMRGPEDEVARGAAHHCGTCGFLVPITGSLGAMFGVCANEYSADGSVVHLHYGCGAHSEVTASNEAAVRRGHTYDDAEVDVVVLPQQLEAAATARRAGAAAEGDREHAETPDAADAAGTGEQAASEDDPEAAGSPATETAAAEPTT